VPADAEAEIGVLVKYLARVGAGGALLEMGGDEGGVGERLGDESAHGLLAGTAGRGPEGFADVGGELRQSIGHRWGPSSLKPGYGVCLPDSLATAAGHCYLQHWGRLAQRAAPLDGGAATVRPPCRL